MCAAPSLFFQNIMPEVSIKEEAIKLFNERIKNKELWPGEFLTKDLFESTSFLLRNVPERVNFFTLEILIREATQAGFEILKAENFGLGINEYIQDCTRREEPSILCYKRV